MEARLSKFFPNIPDICDWCSQAPADLTHMFWLCPSLQEYWRSFFDLMLEILELTMIPSPQIAIFGIPGEGVRLTTKQISVISFASLIAWRRILLLWKKRSPPSNTSWLWDLLSFLKIEKIKFTVCGSTENSITTFSHSSPTFNKAIYLTGLKYQNTVGYKYFYYSEKYMLTLYH